MSGCHLQEHGQIHGPLGQRVVVHEVLLHLGDYQLRPKAGKKQCSVAAAHKCAQPEPHAVCSHTAVLTPTPTGCHSATHTHAHAHTHTHTHTHRHTCTHTCIGGSRPAHCAHLRPQDLDVRLRPILVHFAEVVAKETLPQVCAGDGRRLATAAAAVCQVRKQGVKVSAEVAAGGLLERVKEPGLLLLVHQAVVEHAQHLRQGGMRMRVRTCASA